MARSSDEIAVRFTPKSGHSLTQPTVSCPRRLKGLELRHKVMRKDVQEALKNAVAEFEKRQQAEQERLRERERFETGWTYQPEKQKNAVLINVATKASAAPVGSFALDKITEDFVQTEATKFFTRVASEIG